MTSEGNALMSAVEQALPPPATVAAQSNGAEKPKPKSRARERIESATRANRVLRQENQELECRLMEALALVSRLTERLMEMSR